MRGLSMGKIGIISLAAGSAMVGISESDHENKIRRVTVPVL
jgi:hypothetical protein